MSRLPLLLLTAALTGCAAVRPQAAFEDVQATLAERTDLRVAWSTGSAEDAAVEAEIDRLLADSLTADAAVQVAVLNNRQLQATYEDLGVAQAALVQAGLLVEPGLSRKRAVPVRRRPRHQPGVRRGSPVPGRVRHPAAPRRRARAVPSRPGARRQRRPGPGRRDARRVRPGPSCAFARRDAAADRRQRRGGLSGGAAAPRGGQRAVGGAAGRAGALRAGPSRPGVAPGRSRRAPRGAGAPVGRVRGAGRIRDRWGLAARPRDRRRRSVSRWSARPSPPAYRWRPPGWTLPPPAGGWA